MAWIVVGGGISGFGATKLLIKQGSNVHVYNDKPLTDKEIDRFKILGVEAFYTDPSGDLDNVLSHVCPETEGLIISPGVPLSHPIIQSAMKRRLSISNEIDLALGNYSGDIVAITGTNGKSTTVTMIKHIFDKMEIKSSLAGNIGIPPTELIANDTIEDILILELSSYQLESISRLKPIFAAIINLTPDHLGRHHDICGYLKAKWRIFDGLVPDGQALIHADVLKLSSSCSLDRTNIDLVVFDPSSEENSCVTTETCGLREEHNIWNGIIALRAVAHVTKLPIEKLSHYLKDFVGLDHRFEKFDEMDGRTFINDSKATNVDSTLIALRSCTTPVVLFLGGKPKGESFQPILQHQKQIEVIICFGEAGNKIEAEVDGSLKIMKFQTLAECLAKIDHIINSTKGPLLFSPGCASFDEFENFETRGTCFKTAVKKHLATR